MNQEKEIDVLIKKVIVVSSICGVIITVLLLWNSGQETYSTLYLVPNSYSNYVASDKISFIFGVECFENKNTNYHLNIFLDDTIIEQREFEMSYGKSEWKVMIDIPAETEFPTKLRLVLEANEIIYDTHFWLKGRM